MLCLLHLLISAKVLRYDKAVTLLAMFWYFKGILFRSFEPSPVLIPSNLIAMPMIGVERINQSQYPAYQEAQHASSIIVQYLLEDVAEFRQLTELRWKVNRSGAGTPSQTYGGL
jgi:hypothetical protein